RFRDLNREATDAAGAAMDEDGLSGLAIAPCPPTPATRSRRTLGPPQLRQGESFRFRGYFPFLDRDELRPSTPESWITVNCVACFEVCDLGADFFHHAGDVVTRDQWKVRTPFPSVFAAKG